MKNGKVDVGRASWSCSCLGRRYVFLNVMKKRESYLSCSRGDLIYPSQRGTLSPGKPTLRHICDGEPEKSSLLELTRPFWKGCEGAGRCWNYHVTRRRNAASPISYSATTPARPATKPWPRLLLSFSYSGNYHQLSSIVYIQEYAMLACCCEVKFRL